MLKNRAVAEISMGKPWKGNNTTLAVELVFRICYAKSMMTSDFRKTGALTMDLRDLKIGLAGFEQAYSPIVDFEFISCFSVNQNLCLRLENTVEP